MDHLETLGRKEEKALMRLSISHSRLTSNRQSRGSGFASKSGNTLRKYDVLLSITQIQAYCRNCKPVNV